MLPEYQPNSVAFTTKPNHNIVQQALMNKTKEKQGNRTAFIRQPARVLLVDYSPPFDADTCEYLHDTLVNFFSLVTHLSGPCRTPFFGLIALTSPLENLFNLQHVRGNFPKLHTAFKELNNIARDVSSRVSSDVIIQGLKEAITQFKRQSQSLRQMSTSSCQLEITFLTCRAATSVVRHIEAFFKDIELESIKKIQVVIVQSSEELNKKEGGTPSESSSSPDGDESELSDGGLVDVVSLGKGDHSQDNVTETSLTLKCDLHECLMDPFHLPYQSHLTVCAESANVTSKGVAITKPHVLNYPVHNLTAMKLVNTEAVCESVPYIVRPTVCWKLDWEELESNRQHFYALCSVLKERGLSLLAKTTGPTVALRCHQMAITSSSPQGHFLFLPFDNSLLLKSIAVKELMLPSIVQSSAEKPCDNALSVVASCLDQKSQASKQEGRSNQSVANQQSKRTTSRAQMQQVVFTAPNETVSNTSQNEFRSAAAVFSSSKRFRSNSAANLYNSNPPAFPDDL
ncbi:hypothetical protein pdam_00002711, partial [Pocillopora damicornis]